MLLLSNIIFEITFQFCFDPVKIFLCDLCCWRSLGKKSRSRLCYIALLSLRCSLQPVYKFPRLLSLAARLSLAHLSFFLNNCSDFTLKDKSGETVSCWLMAAPGFAGEHVF